MATTSNNENSKDDFFSSLISNIKSYNGNDPLRPWLQGIKKMKDTLPSQVLKKKLPRFLQKCVETFEADRRYRNDSRYISVWIQLMDYVDDAKVLLGKMEKSHIGSKRAMFYSAYALYYEKHKKFQEAEKIFLLGVQNLAEPAVELQKSYEQFLHRMKLHEERKTKKLMQSEQRMLSESRKLEKGETSKVFYIPTFSSEDQYKKLEQSNTDINLNDSRHGSKEIPATDETIAVKRFVGNAIIEKTEAEDALHHGLVDPTINMKEAMNAISDMFKEPLDLETIARRKSHRSKSKENQENNVLNVYIDSPVAQKNQNESKAQKPSLGAFKIWTEEDDDDVDETSSNVIKEKVNDKDSDDTVVRNFMGSTDSDDSRVENACHHGLVDPTINMKEAMDDINGMFGESVNLMRARRQKKQEALPVKQKAEKQEALPVKQKAEKQGFCILADDDFEEDLSGNASVSMSPKKFGGGSDLFEPTICTREAMADINEMFGNSLDF